MNTKLLLTRENWFTLGSMYSHAVTPWSVLQVLEVTSAFTQTLSQLHYSSVLSCECLCSVLCICRLRLAKEKGAKRNSILFTIFSYFPLYCHSAVTTSNEVQLPVFLLIISLTSYAKEAGTILGCWFKNVAAKRQG